MRRAILSLLVANQFGVLTKVTGLFGRRGYNIKSLSVGETDNSEISRITIVTEGDENTLEQIYQQVLKLEEVLVAKLLPLEQLVERELILVKILPEEKDTETVTTLLETYGAKDIPIPNGGVVVEASGSSDEMTALIEDLKPFQIVELSRTGVTALERSIYSL